MTLNLIPGGEFMMGSPDDEADAFENEKPQHLVRLSAFCLGNYEVTQTEYETVMGDNPSGCRPRGRSTARNPVERVTSWDAVRFCNALSAREHLPPYYNIRGKHVELPDRRAPGYRLPMEAEWEYACRAGKTTRFSFGNDASVLDEAGWYGGNSAGRPHPVAQNGPNGLGLYDMNGNVREWCSDGWDEDYYKKAPEDDPPGASGAASVAFRGGGWDSESRECRSANRYHFAPGNRSYFLGFRVARGEIAR